MGEDIVCGMGFVSEFNWSRETSRGRFGSRLILNSGNRMRVMERKRRWKPSETERKILRFQVPMAF
jgi:hypothetical protein